MSDARDKAVERLALLIFSGAPDAEPWVDALRVLDGQVEIYKASADRNEGNMPVAWTQAVKRAEAVLDLLGLVAVDPALVEAVRSADAAAVASHGAKHTETAEWLAARVKDVPTRMALADAALAQLGAKP